MLQTSIQNQLEAPAVDAIKRGLRSNRVSSKAAEAACSPFFSKTAPAGPIDLPQRVELLAAVMDVLPIQSGRAVPLRSRSSSHLHFLVEGWTYRCVTLSDGSRQITDILLPGDVCDWRVANLADEAGDVRACGPALIATVRRDVIDSPNGSQLRRALEWAHHVESHALRDRLVSLGRRDATGRIAHFMIDLYRRLHALGLASGGTFECHLTQEQIADAVGLTSVHVNRTLQALRRRELLSFSKRVVTIPDPARLNSIAGLDGRTIDAVLGG